MPDAEESLIRRYTLSPQDRLRAQVRRRSYNRDGYADQLCLMRYSARIFGVDERLQGPLQFRGNKPDDSFAEQQHACNEDNALDDCDPGTE